MSSKLSSFTKYFFWITSLLYSLYVCYWIMCQFFSPDSIAPLLEIFSDSYGILVLFSAIIGFFVGQLFGGHRSLLGKSIYSFSVGLLFQFFGQAVYSYYALFLGQEVPYPSLGDLGFFGSIFAYIYGVYLLSSISGVKLSLESFYSKFISIFVPLVILFLSYLLFLREYAFIDKSLLTVFLDFAYPLGQAVYVSMAISTYFLVNGYLGGLMRFRVLLVLIALIIQYFADFIFLYRASQGLWTPGGISDFLYLLSYFSMTIALYSFLPAYKKIKALTGN